MTSSYHYCTAGTIHNNLVEPFCHIALACARYKPTHNELAIPLNKTIKAMQGKSKIVPAHTIAFGSKLYSAQDQTDQRSAVEVSGLSSIPKKNKYSSQLAPDTIRRLNKHQTRANGIYVLPSVEVQLQNMFHSLDKDHSGSIDLNELKSAVRFLEALSKGKLHIAEDSACLLEFFSSMDVNHDGAVSCKEFIAALAQTMQLRDNNETEERNNRLRHAFVDFSNQLQRRQIVQDNIVSPAVAAISDMGLFQELKQLFDIQYFSQDIYEYQNEISKYDACLKVLHTSEYRERRAIDRRRFHCAQQYFAVSDKDSNRGRRSYSNAEQPRQFVQCKLNAQLNKISTSAVSGNSRAVRRLLPAIEAIPLPSLRRSQYYPSRRTMDSYSLTLYNGATALPVVRNEGPTPNCSIRDKGQRNGTGMKASQSLGELPRIKEASTTAGKVDKYRREAHSTLRNTV